MNTLILLSLIICLAPLGGCIIAGLFRKRVGNKGAQCLTILGVAIAFVLSCYMAKLVFVDNQTANANVYSWAISGSFQFAVGFLVDRLTALMMVTVTFVSLLVHIYSIGYMHGDSGYARFFSYISLFTFAMLMLVGANNFLQLFFGWEGVGLVSYLLIGFWFKRESANQGSLKAFIVNRIGDFGFILGIAGVLAYFGSLDYASVFQQVPSVAAAAPTMTLWSHGTFPVITLIAILLFIGAMGKSAQVPLHVWLPESMEGPTPISALIHAATMVTAGIYMVARLSPLYEYAPGALSFILIIGATGALFTGILAIVQNDIKRVVAYSTLSQLGYMVAALGVSAYSAGIFHLVTHACFKALLFLAAGSVIIALHHEQDMRKMGGLWRYLPITYICFLIGALSLSAIPPFAGFFSKDAIIDMVHHSDIFGAGYAYICVLLGSFVTAFYIFRAFFMTFHTDCRVDAETKSHLHESPGVVYWPLIILAIPSVLIGGQLVNSMVLQGNLLTGAITVLPIHQAAIALGADYIDARAMMIDALLTPAFWLASLGVLTAWICYIRVPVIPGKAAVRFSYIYRILVDKYGFDNFNEWFFVKGTRKLASFLYKVGDIKLVDDFMVNGSGRLIAFISSVTRKVQSGYLYHYALAMIIGLLLLIAWIVKS